MFSLISCHPKEALSEKTEKDKVPTVVSITTDTIHHQKTSGKSTYKNLVEVVLDEKSKAWVEIQDGTCSLSLHFNLDCKDTISVAYSPECWLYFPFKIKDDKIIAYWANCIESKYEFDIVVAMNKIDKKYFGKPFMILTLINDTTLLATYPHPELIKMLNSLKQKRTFFPDKFIVSQEF